MNKNNRNNGRLLIFFIFILFFIFIFFFKDNVYIQHYLFLVFLFGGLAGAWNLVCGYGGSISLGHTIYFGIGMYTSTLLFKNFGISPWIGMIGGAILSLAFSLSVGTILVWRLKAAFFALSTLALAEIFRLYTIYFRSITGGYQGITIPPSGGRSNFILQSKLEYVLVAFIFLIIVTAISYFIKSGKLGYYLIAIKEDENAAKSLGINTVKYTSIAYAISAVIVSLGGTFYAQYVRFINPTIGFAEINSVQIALYSIIGGIATVEGPVIGALFFIPIKLFLNDKFGGTLFGFDLLLYGSIFLISVLFFPNGIMGIIKKYLGLKGSANISLMLDKKDEKDSEEERDVFKKIQKAGDGKIILSVENVNKYFGGLHAVKNLNLKLRKGEIVSIIGPNGAGKTTLFNIITGFLKADSGIIKYKDEIINNKAPYSLCLDNGIIRTFQLTRPFSNMTTLENIIVGGFSRCKNKTEVKNKAVEIVKFIGLEKYININVASLPLAFKKRIEIGRALAAEPELLLLDECLAGLNIEEINEAIKLIRKISDNGIDIVIIEHVMKAVMELSDRVIVLDYGENIAEGTPEEISKNKKVLEVYLGLE